MEPHPFITLTTDFGSKDPFTGIMKGVILSINPAVRIIDISHDIEPQNILEAAFVIAMSYRSFPHKTIHVVVIDPGVGSRRRPILVAGDFHYFIGPDNGVFSRIYDLNERCEVVHLNARHYFLPDRSSTFDGRDIFAPVASWLSKGIDISKFGDRITDYVKLPMPASQMKEDNIIQGEVIHIDRFGNLITNIDSGQMKTLNAGKGLKILLKGIEASMKKYYSEAGDGQLNSLINSFGYLELFVKNGSAATGFGVSIGEKVTVGRV